MAVTKDISTGRVAQVSVRDVSPAAAPGPYRIHPRFRFSGLGREDLEADLMTCELGDGRCLAVARILTELQAHERDECAAALANGIFCQFAINQDRLTLLLERGRNGARVALSRVRFVRRDALNVRSKGTWPVRDEDLKFERIPTPDEWPGEWWKMASAPPPLPDTSPLLDLDRALASMGEVLNKLGAAEPAGARESAFGDATIGELLERVERRRAAGERVGTRCVEQIPLARVAPGPEASLRDLIACLVRDFDGPEPGRWPVARVLDLPWRPLVVLQACPLDGWWAVYGKLEADVDANRLRQPAHALALGGRRQLAGELSRRGYGYREGWIDEAAHRGLEIFFRPRVGSSLSDASGANPRDAYSAELNAVRDGAGYSAVDRAFGYRSAKPHFEPSDVSPRFTISPSPASPIDRVSIVDHVNSGAWMARSQEDRP